MICKTVTEEELLGGLHHADFITLKGKLIDRLTQGILSPTGQSDAVKNILVLQNSNLLFTAEKETTRQSSLLASIPIGSVVEVSGICLLQSGEDGKITSLQVLLPASSNVRVLSKPGWLTSPHLLIHTLNRSFSSHHCRELDNHGLKEKFSAEIFDPGERNGSERIAKRA